MTPSVVKFHEWAMLFLGQISTFDFPARKKIAEVHAVYKRLYELLDGNQPIERLEIDDRVATGLIGDFVIIAEPFPAVPTAWVLSRKDKAGKDILPVIRANSVFELYVRMEKAKIKMIPGLLEWASYAMIGDVLTMHNNLSTYKLEIKDG